MNRFHFLRFDDKCHFKGIKKISTDGQTDATDQSKYLTIEAPCWRLKSCSQPPWPTKGTETSTQQDWVAFMSQPY